ISDTSSGTSMAPSWVTPTSTTTARSPRAGRRTSAGAAGAAVSDGPPTPGSATDGEAGEGAVGADAPGTAVVAGGSVDPVVRVVTDRSTPTADGTGGVPASVTDSPAGVAAGRTSSRAVATPISSRPAA